LDIAGSLSVKTMSLNGGPGGTATLITDQAVYFSLTPNSGNLEFLMPNASLVPGRIYIFRNLSNILDAQLYSLGGSFFSKSSNTSTTLPLILPGNAQGKSIIIVSDGVNWTYFN
jgi:hypothetical protein